MYNVPELENAVSETATLAINQYIEELRLKGRKPITLKTVQYCLYQLAKKCDITNPESVRNLLANLQWKDSAKHIAVSNYTAFLTFHGKTWKPPQYTPREEQVYIPTEQQIDALISSTSKNLSVVLQFLKETGARIGEACRITWNDIDLEKRIVSINDPEKGSLPRNVPFSEKLKAMIQLIPRTDKPIFLTNISQEGLRKSLESRRESISKKLADPKILLIHFHTFRHYKATVTMQQMGDSGYVRYVLGHKTSHMTDRYSRQALAQTYDNSQFTSRVTKTLDEEQELVNSGRTLVRAINETTALYRKRK